jgi:hypothetical protein
VLLNFEELGQPIIRKASAHGFGHLIAPYDPEDAPPNVSAPAVPLSEIGVERWQYDLWFQIVRAALDGHPENAVAAAWLRAESIEQGLCPSRLALGGGRQFENCATATPRCAVEIARIIDDQASLGSRTVAAAFETVQHGLCPSCLPFGWRDHFENRPTAGTIAVAVVA